ncbi:glycosyltransferase family 4 protein [Cupriavidus sp. CV2]|uniref:glycosyltransferase family 4 protein n=1 Tax=Cupriavidus ulmosensis TaxID=3065913 RepID=UPI00296B0B45|nr:glycosyltransferase family 4 protein [Cupriavidus sp. CV2]MDW3684544.1 glycosyltransferase family 4 protein [Cupriavidus sp. CV2]
MSGSVTIFHNVVWSRHKGAVFSALHSQSAASSIHYDMVQIAETEHFRLGFSDVDYSFHNYPMHQLYAGCYEDVPRWKMTARLTWEVLKAKGELVVLPGYHRPEYWAMLLACIVTGKRRAVFCDSTGRDRPRRMLTSIPKRVFFSLCHGYFGFGERSREYLMSLGAKPERIFTPCQAAAMPATYKPEHALQERLKHRADSAPVFLYVGRLSEEKGLDTLLEAFAGLHKRMPSVTLRLVGTGPMAGTLRQMAAELGVENAVCQVGSLQDEGLSEEYYRAACMVLPSHSEPWGLVVNEALAHGCPTVVSENCGCVPELVLEGETGFAVPARSVDALQAGMTRALAAFADTQATAERCLAVIRRFDPANAASNIARGCAAMLSEPQVHQRTGVQT